MNNRCSMLPIRQTQNRKITSKFDRIDLQSLLRISEKQSVLKLRLLMNLKTVNTFSISNDRKNAECLGLNVIVGGIRGASCASKTGRRIETENIHRRTYRTSIATKNCFEIDFVVNNYS